MFWLMLRWLCQRELYIDTRFDKIKDGILCTFCVYLLFHIRHKYIECVCVSCILTHSCKQRYEFLYLAGLYSKLIRIPSYYIRIIN